MISRNTLRKDGIGITFRTENSLSKLLRAKTNQNCQLSKKWNLQTKVY